MEFAESELAGQMDALLRAAPFASTPESHDPRFLGVLQSLLAYAAERNPAYARYLDAWPVHYRQSSRIADLPYLPVGAFKANPPLTLVPPERIVRTLSSSATTGQVPSRVALDADTSRRMMKGVTAILRDFIGARRRPFLVIDTDEALSANIELGARGAAIQALRSFATETVCCLKRGRDAELEIDVERLSDFAARFADADVLVYGFTYVVWQSFVQALRRRDAAFAMPKATVLHSGGWKRLQDLSVSRDVFAEGVSTVLGCSTGRIIDFYGMVENVGVVYPDCEHGNKHVPAFAHVLIRDPLTLEPVTMGQQGLVQVCSALTTSFPGFAILTDDIGEVARVDGCACGRRGMAFRFVKRVPKVEIRGCGNIEARHPVAPSRDQARNS